MKALVLGTGDNRAKNRAAVAVVLGLEAASWAGLNYANMAPWNLMIAAILALAAVYTLVLVRRSRAVLADPAFAQAFAQLAPLGSEYTLVAHAQADQEALDLLLLGPHGALVLERKDQSAAYRIDGDEWRLVGAGRAPFLVSSPNPALRRAMQALGIWYAQRRVAATVSGVVVVAADSEIEFGQRSVPVVPWDALPAFVRALPRGDDPRQESAFTRQQEVVAVSSSRLRPAGFRPAVPAARRGSRQTA